MRRTLAMYKNHSLSCSSVSTRKLSYIKPQKKKKKNVRHALSLFHRNPNKALLLIALIIKKTLGDDSNKHKRIHPIANDVDTKKKVT